MSVSRIGFENFFRFLFIYTCNKLEFKEQQQDYGVALTKQNVSCLQDLSVSTQVVFKRCN